MDAILETIKENMNRHCGYGVFPLSGDDLYYLIEKMQTMDNRIKELEEANENNSGSGD